MVSLTSCYQLRQRCLAGGLALLMVALALFVTGCGGDSAPHPEPALAERSAHAAIGQCTRDPVLLRAPFIGTCAVDADCPCGSYCDDALHTCGFRCMVPPASPGEACAAGTQCDDTGRCAGPTAGLPSRAPVLAATPMVLALAPAGASTVPVTVRLALYDLASSDPSFARAAATVVRVLAPSGLQVSCDAATYGDSCELTGWTFTWDGARHNASHTVWARTLADNATADGELLLRIDELDAELRLPAGSSAAPSLDGEYAGVATGATVAGGVPVTVQVAGAWLLVRDPTRALSLDGAFALDALTAGNPIGTGRKLTYLRPVTAAADAGAVVGEVVAEGPLTASAGRLSAGFRVALPGAAPQSWVLDLSRVGAHAAECDAARPCGAGSQCVAELGSCVPQGAWTSPTAPVGNAFEDPRSHEVWTTVSPLFGIGQQAPAPGSPAAPAFATTGADFLEALLCTTDAAETSAGRLGPYAMAYGSGSSVSGDLRCARDAAPPQSGQTPTTTPLGTPTAVGLVSYRDRNPPSSAVSSALLGTCLLDLARAPSTSFAANYAVTVGNCVNPARFLPALRLLATGELEKSTSTTGARQRGLLVRLVQQWSQLHGFLASAGLSEREYDDAVAAGPSEARQELVSLLDVLDTGWGALLDRRVTPMLAAAASWGATATSPVGDYRDAKRPVVYWPFNGLSDRSRPPQRDVVRGVDLVPIAASSKVGCQIRTDRDVISGDFSCPGFRATLPASAPSLASGDLSVAMAVDSTTSEFPPYFGGTLFQTETLAAVASPLGHDSTPTLAFAHPTAGGGVEWVAFQWGFGLSKVNFMIVRDSAAMTYTLTVHQPQDLAEPTRVYTQRYHAPVAGTLPQVAPRTVRLGGGQWPNPAAYNSMMDDFAIFDSALSRREALRFVISRGQVANLRTAWPVDINVPVQPTHDHLHTVAAAILEGQVSYLAVAEYLAKDLVKEAQRACAAEDLIASAALAQGVERVGRSLRQSQLLEALVAADSSARSSKARQALAARRGAVARALGDLGRCTQPYGLARDEVPLYFGDQSGEVTAFFAASDHLLTLAEQRVGSAQRALNAVRADWDEARQSLIQEQLDQDVRGVRVGELERRYGEQLKRLCGITEITAAQVIQQVRDGSFSLDRCFLAPTTACQSAATPIMDADPSCYRGEIGAQLMNARASYHSQRAAYHAYQAAIGNAEAAERLCVYKEMDFYGCSAVNRHQLSGVSCPSGHQGTQQLVESFVAYLDEQDRQGQLFGAVVSAVTSVVGLVASGGTFGAFAAAAGRSLGVLRPVMEGTVETRKRRHAALLQLRAEEAEIRACWTAAEQHQRAIAAAESSSLEAAARMEAAVIRYGNAVAEAREAVVEGPIAIDRELTRPSLPLAFHSWLPEAQASYRAAMDSARRYAYLALRATEYDLQQTFAGPAPEPGDVNAQPSRAAVAGAFRPATLVQQLQLLRAATDARRVGSARPSEDHLVLQVGRDLLGLGPEVMELGPHLAARARPVYSSRGQYLGQGLRFSLVAKNGASAPVWRCAERLLRANVGRAGAVNGSLLVKLLKHTTFGGRDCTSDELRVSTLRPERNLLVAGGETGSLLEQPRHTAAHIDTVDLNLLGNYENFQFADDFSNGSSTELAGQGLFGDYVLLFLESDLTAGLALEAISELLLRFDFLSVDNTPALPAARASSAPTLVVEQSSAPIVLD